MINHQRKLLIVPILHTKEDMGSLGNHLSMADGYTAMVSDFWREVKERVKRSVNGTARVKVYQDGLPDTQKELVEKIISEVQSPNYELLRSLKDKGSNVLGTEDPELLEEEYKFTSDLVRSQENTSEGIAVKAASLLARRDAYIVNRIDKTLNSGELGVLFIGAAHDIKERLPANIQIEIL